MILISRAGHQECLTGIEDYSRQHRWPSAAARRVSWGVIGGCAEPRALLGILMLVLNWYFRVNLLADASDVLQTVLLVRYIHRASRTGPI